MHNCFLIKNLQRKLFGHYNVYSGGSVGLIFGKASFDWSRSIAWELASMGRETTSVCMDVWCLVSDQKADDIAKAGREGGMCLYLSIQLSCGYSLRYLQIIFKLPANFVCPLAHPTWR